MENANCYTRIHSKTISGQTNHKIQQSFHIQQQLPGVKKTHLFEGRYENIYLNEQHIPELIDVREEALILAKDILNINNLRAGYWFNYMPPGSTTTLHTHDDDDELLSAVYYVDVPENSGNLIIFDDLINDTNKQIEITPEVGEYIFFKPNIRHQVTKNNSNQHRLSIGINFGKNT